MNAKLVVALVGLYVLACVCLVSGEENMKYQDVTLTLTVPEEINLGNDVVFALILECESKQSLYSLETADIQIDMEMIGGATTKYHFDRGQIRQIKETLADGRSLVETIKVQKQRVTIAKGDSSRIDISMLRDFNTRLSCGKYSVSVVYEGKVKANASFSVVVDYERTVPMLIDLIAGPDEWTRSWARDALVSVVGRPMWKPLRDDTNERIDSEVGALRKWWKENKDLVLLIELNAKREATVKRKGD